MVVVVVGWARGGVVRGGVEGGDLHFRHTSSGEMGGSAAPGSTNSSSDTGFACNSGGNGGLLLVQKATSYNLDVCSGVPRWRRSSESGVSGPAEDLRLVSVPGEPFCPKSTAVAFICNPA